MDISSVDATVGTVLADGISFVATGFVTDR